VVKLSRTAHAYLGRRRKETVHKIAKKMNITASDLIRRAIDDYIEIIRVVYKERNTSNEP